MKYLLLCLFLCLSTTTLLMAQTTVVHCSHHEVCKLVDQIILEEELKNIKTETLITISGDPHEFEPNSQQIKQLLSAPVLFSGPLELTPWMKKIHFQRSKNASLKSFDMSLNTTMLTLYPKSNAEVLAHFWLYPKIYCQLKEKAYESLKIQPKSNIECSYESIESELVNELNKLKIPVVLTHDALKSIFHKSNIEVIALKGSGHHHEITSSSIKKLTNTLKESKVLWIIEKGIHVPSHVLAKKRKSDFVIEIDTSLSEPNVPLGTLRKLTQKIKDLK